MMALYSGRAVIVVAYKEQSRQGSKEVWLNSESSWIEDLIALFFHHFRLSKNNNIQLHQILMIKFLS